MKRNYSIAAGKKLFLSLFLCIVMALSLPELAHAQEQPFWNYNGGSYLYVNESGGLTRVLRDSPGWFSGNKIIYVENYDSSFKLQTRYEIAGELNSFGCFFAGAEYNYMVFGQENPNENDSVEVIRVVKYSKNWERLGQASIYGANTTIPFRSGACRCAESGGMLYIRTCHQMYKSSDGKNHQANMMLVIRESDMTLTDKNWGVSFLDTGYVSHSFDQYVLTDQEGNVVALDLGDAYPRAVVLTRFNGKAGKETLEVSHSPWISAHQSNASNATIQKISGNIGDNYTGVSIGGFAETTSGYVTAYAYNGGNGPQAVYLAYTNKSDLSTHTTQLSAPVGSVSSLNLVPTGTSGGYILWNHKTDDGSVLYYAAYGADGSVGEFHAAAEAQSNSNPIFYNGKIVWSDCTRANIRSGESYDMIMNFYLLDDAGVETITASAMYPFGKPYFLY